MIKCKTTGEVYVGRTESVNPKYNPISVLYNRYKKDDSKYVALGECIKQHGFSDFVFTFIKTTTDEDSEALIKKVRDTYKSLSLNDDQKDAKDYFSAEMEMMKNW